MRRGVASLVLLGVLASACEPAATEREPGSEDRRARPTATPEVAGASAATGPTAPTGTEGHERFEAPAPDARVPHDPARLAQLLVEVWAERRVAVDAWVASGGSATWPPPEHLELLVLFEQRVYRALATDRRLAERVLRRLPRGLAAEARANVAAGRALYEHFSPVSRVPDFRIRPPEPAKTLLRHFRAAERRFGVGWELLAAVMLIETRMGRVVSRSSAGAQGPMQFLPATWAAYGLGGDVRDPRDAVMGAANYLRASGAPDDERGALYRYNPVRAYVVAVSRYADAMRRDPSAFYAYYHWQVFVRTARGDVRLSGPGLPPR